jgi:hypothetical protein
VLTAGNLGIALGICDLHRPDVVVLDAILPQQPCEEAIDSLLTRVDPPPRVVLMTGVAPEPLTRESGVRRIRAPFRAEDLVALVDEISVA